MRKKILLVVLVACLVNLSGISFCQEATEEAKAPMKYKGMKEKGYMHGMMMKKMMSKEMVATKDGGVVVLFGNKLMKYDKNLNLVKETKIKIDMEAMKKKMRECMKMMKEQDADEASE